MHAGVASAVIKYYRAFTIPAMTTLSSNFALRINGSNALLRVSTFQSEFVKIRPSCNMFFVKACGAVVERTQGEAYRLLRNIDSSQTHSLRYLGCNRMTCRCGTCVRREFSSVSCSDFWPVGYSVIDVESISRLDMSAASHDISRVSFGTSFISTDSRLCHLLSFLLLNHLNSSVALVSPL